MVSDPQVGERLLEQQPDQRRVQVGLVADRVHQLRQVVVDLIVVQLADVVHGGLSHVDICIAGQQQLQRIDRGQVTPASDQIVGGEQTVRLPARCRAEHLR